MNSSTAMFIPERFKKAIFVHIFKNLWSNQLPSAPLILGIHGPSGVGKTFQCEHLLKSLGVQVYLISGGQFENRDAGEPARLLRQTYRDAGTAILDGETKLAVLLINDIDTGLGNWGDNVQTTVNTQTVIGELMHITDYPTIVDNRKTPRIPIIVTGNDFTKLYSPLIRAGRMASFEWKPTTDEKIKIVSRIFYEFTEDECAHLVKDLQRYSEELKHVDDLEVALFSELRSVLHDEFIWTILLKHGVQNVLEQHLSGKQPKLNINVDLSRAIQTGKQLISSSRYSNHLNGK